MVIRHIYYNAVQKALEICYMLTNSEYSFIVSVKTLDWFVLSLVLAAPVFLIMVKKRKKKKADVSTTKCLSVWHQILKILPRNTGIERSKLYHLSYSRCLYCKKSPSGISQNLNEEYIYIL